MFVFYSSSLSSYFPNKMFLGLNAKKRVAKNGCFEAVHKGPNVG